MCYRVYRFRGYQGGDGRPLSAMLKVRGEKVKSSHYRRRRRNQKVNIRRKVNLTLTLQSSLDKRVNAVTAKYEKTPYVKPTGYPIPTSGR